MRMRERCQLIGRLERSLAQDFWQEHPLKLIKGLWDRLKVREKAELLSWAMSEESPPVMSPTEEAAIDLQIQRQASRLAWSDLGPTKNPLNEAWEAAWPEARVAFMRNHGLMPNPAYTPRRPGRDDQRAWLTQVFEQTARDEPDPE